MAMTTAKSMENTMVIEGIDRLVIGVKDMDRALDLFKNAFGVEFTEAVGAAPEVAGCRLAISFDKHLELISPVAPPKQETNPPDPLELKRRLDAAGEAILYALVYKVKDLDAAIANAAEHGVRVTGTRLEFARDEQFGLSSLAEVALDENDTLGIKMAFVKYDRD
jgi:catechol 2,3-dioxygenase-like lactoylglutathione lyase family enzyme